MLEVGAGDGDTAAGMEAVVGTAVAADGMAEEGVGDMVVADTDKPRLLLSDSQQVRA